MPYNRFAKYRIQMDENELTNAERIAWDMILPYQHLVILSSDRDRVDKCANFLEKVFTEEQLESAVEKIIGE